MPGSYRHLRLPTSVGGWTRLVGVGAGGDGTGCNHEARRATRRRGKCAVRRAR